MTFDEVLTQIIDLLKRQGRVSYRALKMRFNLDDEYLDVLKEELIDAQGLDHGVGHFRPLSLTRQRRLLAYHDIAISHEGLCQVFRQLFLTATHWILIA